MNKSILKLIKIFPVREKYILVFCLIFIVFSNLLQLIGIASIIPVINIIFDIQNNLSTSIFSFFKKEFEIYDEEIIKRIIILLSFFLVILSQALNILNIHISTKLGLFFYKRIQTLFFLFYNNVDYNFFRKKSLSQVYSNFQDGLDRFSDILIPSCINIFMHLSMAAIILLSLLIINIKVSLVVLFIFSLSYLIFFLYKNKTLRKISLDITNIKKKRTKFLLNILQNLKYIKFFFSKKFLEKNFDSILEKDNQINYSARIIENLPRVLIEFLIFNLILLFLFFYTLGGSNIISYTELIFFGIASAKLLPIVNNVAYSYARIKGTITVLNLFDREIDLMSKSYVKKGKLMVKSIENLKTFNLKIKYSKNSNYINYKDIYICKGDILGILGKSGVGKTSFADVLTTVLNPTSGKIYLNGININKYETTSLLKSISYVGQDFKNLMDGKIKDIISYGSGYNGNILDCLKLSNSYEFVKNLPFKQNTIIGENGINLSGGQKQRLALARAFYKKPQLIVLDESTNALDEKTEKKIFDKLKSLGIIIIIISHNIKLLKNCNIIYNLNKKQIIRKSNLKK